MHDTRNSHIVSLPGMTQRVVFPIRRKSSLSAAFCSYCVIGVPPVRLCLADGAQKLTQLRAIAVQQNADAVDFRRQYADAEG